MKTILFILGTRPEAIKLAPVILKAKASKLFNIKVCTTGQHREMLDQILKVFSIQPDIDLNIMQENQRLAGLSARLLISLDNVISETKPDLVMLQGDTTTVFCAALICYYNKIKVAHVEAGLRTHNKLSPFPEELNRVFTGYISHWHFAPTDVAQKNLITEGVKSEDILVTGNTVIDALLIAQELLRNSKQNLLISEDIKSLISDGRRIVLITSHRRENFGDGIRFICKSIASLSDMFDDIIFVYPVHLNPNILIPVQELLANRTNVKLLPPLDYPSFITLMDHSYMIMTDSGGVQEEAAALKKPLLILRDTTERAEALQSGSSILVGTEVNSVTKKAAEILKNEEVYSKMASSPNPFGNGTASQKILDFIRDNLV